MGCMVSLQVCGRKLALDNFTGGSKGEKGGLTNTKMYTFWSKILLRGHFFLCTDKKKTDTD